MIINVCFVAFETFWRRCFGSDGWQIPVLKIRGVQHVLNCIVLLAFFYYQRQLDIYESIYCTTVIEIFFYTLSFYVSFDMGRAYPPTQEMLDDYNNWIGKVTDLIVYQRDYYRFGYDFVWFTIRYTYPLVFLLPFYSASLLLVGILVATSYAIGWNLHEKGKIKLGGTELGEYCMGAILGIGLILC